MNTLTETSTVEPAACRSWNCQIRGGLLNKELSRHSWNGRFWWNGLSAQGSWKHCCSIYKIGKNRIPETLNVKLLTPSSSGSYLLAENSTSLAWLLFLLFLCYRTFLTLSLQFLSCSKQCSKLPACVSEQLFPVINFSCNINFTHIERNKFKYRRKKLREETLVTWHIIIIIYVLKPGPLRTGRLQLSF